MTLNGLSPSPLTLSDLVWFEGDDAGEDSGLGCNRDYRDLRGLTVEDLLRVVSAETRLIEQVVSGECRPGRSDGDDNSELEIEGLELGAASALVALSVVGCIPYTSCNGGAFGGVHAADRLTVGFYMRRHHAKILRDASRGAGVQLTDDGCGGVYVVAEDPRSMVVFAQRLGGLVG